MPVEAPSRHEQDLSFVQRVLTGDAAAAAELRSRYQGKLVGVVSRADLVKDVATRWVCSVCGEVTHGEQQPEQCPRCQAKNVAAASEPVAPGS